MPLGWVAAATVVAGAASAVIGSDASRRSAHTQADAARAANETEMSQFQQTRADLAPFAQGGTNAFNLLSSQVQDPQSMLNTPFDARKFQSSPGYKFQLGQGLDAIRNSSSAHGGRFSGNTLKALTQFGEGIANQDYWNQYNAYTQQQQQNYQRLMGVAGVGEDAAAQTGTFGANAADQISGNQIGAGNANAAGIAGQANAINNGLNSITQSAYLYGGGSGIQTSAMNQYAGSDPYFSGAYGAPAGLNAGGNFAISDRRAKKDIKKVGQLDNGLPVYSYSYLWDDLPQIGLMADEVEQVNPKAVRNHLSGLKSVNYAEAVA